jgi:hypothetical protein
MESQFKSDQERDDMEYDPLTESIITDLREVADLETVIDLPDGST